MDIDGHNPESPARLGHAKKITDRCPLSFAPNNDPVTRRHNIPDLKPKVWHLGDPSTPSCDRRLAVIAGVGGAAILPILCRAGFEISAHVSRSCRSKCIVDGTYDLDKPGRGIGLPVQQEMAQPRR